MKTRWIVIVAVLLAGLGVFFAGPRTDERLIDINSGRLMMRHYVLGIKVRDRIKETPFSLLAGQLSLTKSPANWRYADSTTRDWYPAGGIIYSDNQYGGAIGCCDLLVKTFVLQNCGEAVKKDEVTLFLRLLRDGPRREMEGLMNDEINKLLSEHP